MPRHAGQSRYHDGALAYRTRRARKARGKKKQSLKDKLAHAARERSRPWT